MEDRARLSNDVYKHWRRWNATTKNTDVNCVWCGKVVRFGADLHEAFVKRSAVHVEQQDLIMVRENCFLVHHDCHMDYGQTTEMKRKALRMVALDRVNELYDVGKWYVSLWKKHELPVPHGLLVPRRMIPMHVGLRMMEYGAVMDNVHWPTDSSSWLIDGGKSGSWDYRALVMNKWAGRSRKGFRKPPEAWGAYDLDRVVRYLVEGYWLVYLSGVLGVGTPEEVLA
jgi:hypothetical protein